MNLKTFSIEKRRYARSICPWRSLYLSITAYLPANSIRLNKYRKLS